MKLMNKCECCSECPFVPCITMVRTLQRYKAPSHEKYKCENVLLSLLVHNESHGTHKGSSGVTLCMFVHQNRTLQQRIY